MINLMTPESASTTHYFWAFARNFRLDEPGVTEFLRANVGRTFDEDKDMLEATATQPRQRGRAGVPASPVKAGCRPDAGPAAARARMIEAETRGG